MPRRYYRKSVKFTGKGNWSHENKGCAASFGEALVNNLAQGGSIIVPASNVQGTRTIGNLTVTVPVMGTSANNNEYYWAVVYVPQGETAKALFATTGNLDGSLYEPNQYVMASRISDGTAGPIRIRSKIMRKLHSGDFISLIVGTPNATQVGESFRALVSYSIKYN